MINASNRWLGIFGMSKRKDLTGYKTGELTVLGFSHKTKRADRQGYRTYWLCQCSCGQQCTVVTSAIRGGQKTCGCLRNKMAADRFIEFNNSKESIKHRKQQTLNASQDRVGNVTAILREYIKRRDGWQCRMCKYPFDQKILWNPYFNHYPPHEYRLDVHHINGQSLEPDNLITLCVSCHRKVDSARRVDNGNGKAYQMMLLRMAKDNKMRLSDWREELFYMRKGLWNMPPEKLGLHRRIRKIG